MTARLKHLPIEWLQRGRYQPRQSFHSEALQELANSIQQQGLIEPLVVREVGRESYEIIAGERRFRAAMQIGLHTLPCIIAQYTDEDAAAIALIENIQRKDLNPIEEAHGYRQLIETFHFYQEEAATLVGKSRSHIANLLRLLTLHPNLQEAIQLEQLSFGHARMLVGQTADIQNTLLHKILQNGWSVRRLEQEIRNHKTASFKKAPPDKLNPDLTHLESALSEHLAAPVHIKHDSDKTSGWLQIKFYNNDTLSGLLERLGLRYDE